MSTYRATYQTYINLTVTVTADTEGQAEDRAHRQAQEYLDTLMGDHRGVLAEATLDGIGADEFEEIDPKDESATTPTIDVMVVLNDDTWKSVIHRAAHADITNHAAGTKP